MANQEGIGGADPHEEIVRLEEHIEGLAAKIESCRKFILAARITVAGGGLDRCPALPHRSAAARPSLY